MAEALKSISVRESYLFAVFADTLLFQHDDQLVKDYGVNLVVNIVQKLRSEGNIAGFHFCTLNLEKSVQRVLDSLGWTGGASEASSTSNKLIIVRISSQ